MDASDIIALYGALLASLLAVIQYRQWQAAEMPLVVTVNKDFAGPPEHMEAMITNVQQSDVYLDFVGIGYRYRPWRAPWKRAFEAIHSMKACENGYLSGKGAEGIVRPGSFMEVYFTREDFNSLQRPSARTGFGTRLCLWVDHSRSDQPLCKVIQ
ncbi:MAG TPA: hypothetical protein VF718_09545 [Allosphingosinicella sp.]